LAKEWIMAQNDENLANLDLNELRAEIDDIDQTMQALIIRRTRVVQAVGAFKDRQIAAGSKVHVPYRPAREARIMRTLVRRHEGAFPKTALIQIWRELIAAGTRLEAPYTVALCRDADGQDCWELARLNFGCLNEIVEFDSQLDAIHALEEGRAAVGVFPAPVPGEGHSWWPLIDRDSAVKVVSKLPFGGRPVGRGEDTEGFVLAAIDLEESGDDRTLFMVTLDLSCDAAALRKDFAKACPGSAILGVFSPDATNHCFVLVDVPGFLCNQGENFRHTLLDHGLKCGDVRVLGAYGVPIPATEM
jgi:chorismate mutase